MISSSFLPLVEHTYDFSVLFSTCDHLAFQQRDEILDKAPPPHQVRKTMYANSIAGTVRCILLLKCSISDRTPDDGSHGTFRNYLCSLSEKPIVIELNLCSLLKRTVRL